MSITAFPVLARILTDKGISGTELGIVALSCAAINDVTAWCLLVFVSGVAQSQLGGALRVVLLTVCYIVCMFLVARPLFSRFITRYDTDGRRQDGVALVLVAMLLSALITELIGIHAIFGAFLLGAIIPRDSALARDLTRQLKDVVVVLLLPAFFAYT